MNRIFLIGSVLVATLVAAVYLSGNCASAAEYGTTLMPRLSDYKIFAGDPAALIPGNGFQLYELATGLFTDYAEKQRLIKLPVGKTIVAVNDGLPQFSDKRDPLKGKRLIETRLLIKLNGQWLAGTYVWNNEQTDAMLESKGANVPVSWID